jgi:hypothetical protein
VRHHPARDRLRLYGKVDRTPILGAAISAAPVLLLCAGIGATAALR